MKRYHHFFETYQLDIEIGNFKEHPILKQGDSIFASNRCENPPTGTLGGFVMKVNEERKKYAFSRAEIKLHMSMVPMKVLKDKLVPAFSQGVTFLVILLLSK